MIDCSSGRWLFLVPGTHAGRRRRERLADFLMHSQLATELRLRFHPVAILFSDAKPDGALQLAEGQWGCVMAHYAAVIKKGKTAVFDRQTFGCIGAGVGLCLGNSYEPSREFMKNLLADQEGHMRDHELVEEFMDSFDYVDIPNRYVVFRPLEDIEPAVEAPALVSFPVNADQLSALAYLIKFRRPGLEHTIAPFGAGCQSVCVLPYNESGKQYPRAVIGNLDPSSRKLFPADLLTFTVPFATYLDLEDDLPHSFLRKEVWHPIANRLTASGEHG